MASWLKEPPVEPLLGRESYRDFADLVADVRRDANGTRRHCKQEVRVSTIRGRARGSYLRLLLSTCHCEAQEPPGNRGRWRLLSCAPSVAPDGNALAALGADGGLRLRDRVGGGWWERRRGGAERRLERHRGYQHRVNMLFVVEVCEQR